MKTVTDDEIYQAARELLGDEIGSPGSINRNPSTEYQRAILELTGDITGRGSIEDRRVLAADLGMSYSQIYNSTEARRG